MHKLTDHLTAWLAILDKYAQEAQSFGSVGTLALGLVAGLIHTASTALAHSPLTITTNTPPPPAA